MLIVVSYREMTKWMGVIVKGKVDRSEWVSYYGRAATVGVVKLILGAIPA